jgi:hypothetical protein
MEVMNARTAFHQAYRPREPKFRVPYWVPGVLVKEYLAVCDCDGEFAAAKWAREEKKKMVSK